MNNIKFLSHKRIRCIIIEEIDNAELYFITKIKIIKFDAEYNAMLGGNLTFNKTRLQSPNLFFDANRVVKIGDFLNHADLSLPKKHQFILPATGTLCKLL